MSSKRKWLWIGIVIALLNPVFSGIILGAAFLIEPSFKKEGRIILVIAIIWGLVFIWLSRWLANKGLMPVI